jgi:hypothetical protein
MSRAQRIDDHGSPFGSRSKNTVFPEGPHKVKTETSAVGAGGQDDYDQTTEDIKRDQDAGIKKAEGRRMKPGYRN